MKLQNSRIVGDRVYIVLLIADRDGEEMLKSLSGEDEESRHEEEIARRQAQSSPRAA